MKHTTKIINFLIALLLVACKKESNSIKLDNDLIVIKQDKLMMKIKPSYGARIVSFQLDGMEVLATSSDSPEQYGSTFWPSPQSQWGWPPLKTIDEKPYKFLIFSDQVVMESDKDSLLGIKVIKTFIPDKKIEAIKIIYEIVNQTDSTIWVAPWEITRVVPHGGIVFYPCTNEKYMGTNSFQEISLKKINDICYWMYDSKDINDHHKSFSFGKEGWLAFAKKNLLFIKQFEDLHFTDVAPNEGEIELYANPNKLYIEIEQQGKYLKLEPNQRLKWSVIWSLYRLKEEASSYDISDLVREVYRNRNKVKNVNQL
jgi:hypothetical protein